MELKDMGTIGTMFVLAGIALGLGVVINSEFSEQTRTQTVTVNQSFTVDGTTNKTNQLLTNSLVTGITFVANNTLILGSGNYTLTAGDEASYINITATSIPGLPASSTWNVTYTAMAKTSATLAASNGTSGLAQLSSWLPIIGLIVAASIIIGLLFSSFYTGRRQ